MSWVFAPMKPQQRGLMSLPAELRERIFAFALSSDKPLVTFHIDEYQREVYEEASQPALLAVSKQVRQETLLLYYQSNDFIFHSEGKKADDAEQWLQYSLPYLDRLGSIVFWLRAMSNTTYPAGPQGAIAISMRYVPRSECWKVANDWNWISTVKRSADADADGDFLIHKLQEFMLYQPRSLTVSFIAELMRKLRKQYIDYKIH